MKRPIREQASVQEVLNAEADVHEAIQRRLKKHGCGKFVSRHEALGVVAEEYHELVEAARKDNTNEFEKELMDLAVASVFAIVSLKEE